MVTMTTNQFIDLETVPCGVCGTRMVQFPPEWVPEICPDCAANEQTKRQPGCHCWRGAPHAHDCPARP